MKMHRLTVTLQIETATDHLSSNLLQRIELNIEGTVEGTLKANGCRAESVSAIVRREGEG